MALSCPNLPYFPIVYYGILKAGAVVVPLNVLLKGREIAYHLDDSDAKAYFCFEGTADLPMGDRGLRRLRAGRRLRALLPDHRRPGRALADRGRRRRSAQALARTAADLRDGARPSATDTAVILYTSGTTGQPKGAELTHSNMVLNALACNRLFGTAPTTDAPPGHAAAVPLVRLRPCR